MKIFVSSIISGFEPFRLAAREAIQHLGHEAVLAEDWSASPSSPQAACFAAIDDADIVILLLGDEYGHPQAPSQLSATHQEFRHAKHAKPIIALTMSEANFSESQLAFVREVQDWKDGCYTAEFSTPIELALVVEKSLRHRESDTPSMSPPNASPHDIRLYQLFLRTLPSSENIRFLAEYDFGGTGQRSEDLRQIREFYHIWRGPEFEFTDPTLEDILCDLWQAIDDFYTARSGNIFPDHSGETFSVPREWAIDDPWKHGQIVQTINDRASAIVKAHANLVRQGRKRLGI